MLYIKACHIIFVVTWFSGMFYLVRLFIYHREAQDKNPTERTILSNQYNIMIPRLLYGITLPSAIITFIMGCLLLSYYRSIPSWLWVKFVLLFPLYLYHISLHHIWKKQKSGIFNYSSNKLRIWNEVATLFLFAIVFTAVTKNTISFVYGLTGFVILTITLLLAIKVYRRIRESGHDNV